VKLRILLVEDDFLQRDSIRKALEQNFEGAVVDTKVSESEFLRDFEATACNPPDIAVIDVMLRWANPSRDAPMPPPEPWEPQRAGLRCAQRVHDDGRTSGAKIILYTVFDRVNMDDVQPPEGAIWLTKELSFQELIDTVKGLLPATSGK
jgi:DNA-binding NarL/FixJ family response regulator